MSFCYLQSKLDTNSAARSKLSYWVT